LFGEEFITFAHNEVAFACHQIKQLLRLIHEPVHLKFVTACELPLFGHFSNGVKINCEMPTRKTKTSFPLFGYENNLGQTVLPTFEYGVKSYLLVQHNTKQEPADQQPSIAEKSVTELDAPQLGQLCGTRNLFLLYQRQ